MNPHSRCDSFEDCGVRKPSGNLKRVTNSFPGERQVQNLAYDVGRITDLKMAF